MQAELQYTPPVEIDALIEKGRRYFNSRRLALSGDAKRADSKKRDLQFRIHQLQKLYYSIKDHQEEILEALMLDFHRVHHETMALELIPLVNDILLMIEQLPQWYKPTNLKGGAPPYMFGKIEVERIARGVTVVISPFNFPLLLALTPLANTIAGGNSVILKPSELTPHISKLMELIIQDAKFPDGLVSIVQGGIPETTSLINNPHIDMIFYTGSPRVGSIVATAAAKNLVPCVLELGGKSPVFFTKNFNMSHLRTALKRIFFGAFSNGGQLCVRPDYILVHESKYIEFVQMCRIVLDELFPTLNNNTDNETNEIQITHMISRPAYDRTMAKLNSTKGKPYIPQSFVNSKDNTEARLLFPPTLICDADWDDSTMQEENFAPMLPILKYTDLDEAIDSVIKYHDTPLVQYIFSNSQRDIDHILTRVRSGDCVINETVIHVGIQEAPFGGIGTSGYGNYGGEHGFKAFTHERTVFKQPFWMDFILAMRYFPYTKGKTKLIEFSTENKPTFNRNGTKKITISKIFKSIFLPVVLAILYYKYDAACQYFHY